MSAPNAGAARLAAAEAGGLRFGAGFDSGGLARVEQRADGVFVVWTRADCAGTPHAVRSSTWFSFSVSGAASGRVIEIEVRGLNPQEKLFQHGMRPVCRALPS